MSTESKDFDPYAIVLADLLAKKEQIDSAIHAIEMVRGINATSASLSQVATINSNTDSAGAYLGMSISEATIKLLQTKRKQMTNSEILAALKSGGMVLNSADPLNTVGAVITRRSKDTGDIVKVGRGIWGLREWYPGRSFNKNNKNTQNEDVKASSSEPL